MKYLHMHSFAKPGSLLTLACLVTLFAQCSSPQSVRQYTVNRTSSPMQIDGRVTEPGWANAPLTEPFLLYGRSSHFRTQAKMLWDDTCLYVAFICEATDVWTTCTQRDGNLYKNDVVEVFCDPDGDGLNYCEIEANPLNVVADLTLNKPYSAGGSGNWGWNLAAFRSGVQVDGTVNEKQTAGT